MHLLLPRFQLLQPRAQLAHVLLAGTHLANRWRSTRLIRLYYLPDGGRGFFAEIGMEDGHEPAVVLRSFSDSEALVDYAHGMRLPGE